ncbi:hypothetical protein J7U46_20885 [Pelomonas sp. V22]|uniref:hypothetical protein n=1 Tax=Pelomonas sp. V22 TaxID=2822139 RepID=UPI0024A9CB48|nr:hypothetical protein [Pelomonas sp. V22]MDI4635532.1 hypothetical protein [Pelomonas sp. V22]
MSQTIRELLRLSYLSWKSNRTDEEHAERIALSKRYASAIFNILVWPISALLSLLGIIAACRQPYTGLNAILATTAILLGLVLVKKVAAAIENRLGRTPLLLSRLALIAITLPLTAIHTDRAEVAWYESLTTEERAAYDARQQRETEQQDRKDKSLAEAARQAEFEAQRKANEAANLERQAQAVKEANSEQRDFYASLGAPKLLYRCANNEREIAIGAKFGSINSLIAEVQSQCGGTYEILKRKE